MYSSSRISVYISTLVGGLNVTEGLFLNVFILLLCDPLSSIDGDRFLNLWATHATPFPYGEITLLSVGLIAETGVIFSEESLSNSKLGT